MEQQRRMKKVQQKFRMKGFTLTLDALKAAVGFVYEASGSSRDAMESLLASTDDHPSSLRSNVLDKATVEAIIAEVKGVDDHTQGRRVLQVVDAFAVPKISFDPVRKLLHAQSGSGAFHGGSCVFLLAFGVLRPRQPCLGSAREARVSARVALSVTGRCCVTTSRGLPSEALRWSLHMRFG